MLVENNIEKRIVEKARDQFLKYGIRTISMDDIANELGVSKKTIYKYYKDKKTLVKKVTTQVVDNVQYTCTNTFDKSKNAIEQLLGLADFINSFFENMNPAVFYDLEKYFPSSYKILQEHHEVFIFNSIKDNYKRGVSEGFFRESIDVDILAKLRLAQIRSAYDTSLFPPNKYNLREVQLVALELTMLGIATEKGKKLIEKYKNKNS